MLKLRTGAPADICEMRIQLQCSFTNLNNTFSPPPDYRMSTAMTCLTIGVHS